MPKSRLLVFEACTVKILLPNCLCWTVFLFMIEVCAIFAKNVYLKRVLLQIYWNASFKSISECVNMEASTRYYRMFPWLEWLLISYMFAAHSWMFLLYSLYRQSWLYLFRDLYFHKCCTYILLQSCLNWAEKEKLCLEAIWIYSVYALFVWSILM